MMKENKNYPPECENCSEDCYNCDTAGEQYHWTAREQLEVERKLTIQAISRYKRQLTEIENKIFMLEHDRDKEQ